jgi:hypothetical protein
MPRSETTEPDDDLGLVAITVRYKEADGRSRQEVRMYTCWSWELDRGGLRQEVLEMIDGAFKDAREVERLARYAAGPRGVLP